MAALLLSSCRIVATVAPGGSSMIVDLLLNGTSVFGGNPKPTVSVGSTSVATYSTFATSSVGVNDILTAKLIQIDSGVGGGDGAGCPAHGLQFVWIRLRISARLKRC
jgi:hypothetical protein